MLANFIRRGGKRKGSKASGHHHKSASASSSLVPSSAVLNIGEESPSPSATHGARLVELSLPHSNEDWFPQEWLRSRSGSPGFSPSEAQKVTATEKRSEVHVASLPTLSRTSSGEDASPARPGHIPRKKSIPAPIFIPDIDILKPDVQIGRSAVPPNAPSLEKSRTNVNHAPLSPPSPSPSDNLSAISGTTLARALIGSSFVLSSHEQRRSRHRSGLARQDSATLPHGDTGSLFSTGRSSPVPPVPPVPALLVPNHFPPSIGSGASTESEYPATDSYYITSPEIATGFSAPRQVPRTKEGSLPTASVSIKSAPCVVSNTTPQRQAGSASARTRVAENGASRGPRTAIELKVPIIIHGTTQHSPREGSSFSPGSDSHSLDEFDFLPPEPSAGSVSPATDMSTSPIRSLPSRPGGANRGQRTRGVGGSNNVRNGSKDHSFSDGVPAPQSSYGIPAEVSEHDFGELINCDMTVSPDSTSARSPWSVSAGYQTFPETPVVFSPLFSGAYSKIDGQGLRRRPPSMKSAKLGYGKPYSSVRTVKRHFGNSAAALRRSQSSSLPAKKIFLQKRADSSPSPSRGNDGVGTPDETGQSSATNTKEPERIVENQPAVRPHPLAHISSTSSCMPEEEALRALAPHSISSFSSITIGDTDVLYNSMVVSASTTDPSIQSPISAPLPESINESPSNSPAFTDGVSAASPSISPLQPSVPVAPSTRQPVPLNTSSSTASSSLGGSSFLPSPSSPSSWNESLAHTQSTIPAAFSRAMADVLRSPSLSSIPPPPYHTVVSERTAHYTPASRTSPEPDHQFSRQASNSSMASNSLRTRIRARPPLPIGPRKPSPRTQILGSFVSGIRARNSSVSSVGSGDLAGSPGSLWRKLQSVISKPPPKFHPPPPKWRGLTLEAAQWTFTSPQLQELVSRAIQQASEGSTLRLLRLEVLEGEIADEMHRLELQHTDVKAQYKALVRKRWTLMGALASHIEGIEMNDVSAVARTIEDLAEVLSTLDHLADKMHSIVLEMAQLKSLRDVHNASALALAVRKINGLLIRQMAEKEGLQEQIDTLQTERDEAWRHAEDIAQDYDNLNDRVSETAGISGEGGANADAQSLASSSKRSTRISAVRKSSVRLSQAGLRSRSRPRPSRSPGSATPASAALEDTIPPVPRLPIKPLLIRSPTLGPPTASLLSGTMHSSGTPATDTLALAEAQREVYEMLGLSVPPSQASSRPRTLSGTGLPRPPSLASRPVSESLEARAQQSQRRQRRQLHLSERDRGAIASWAM